MLAALAAVIVVPTALAYWTTVYFVGQVSPNYVGGWVAANQDNVDGGYSYNNGLAFTACLSQTGSCTTNYSAQDRIYMNDLGGTWHCSTYANGGTSCYLSGGTTIYTRAHCKNLNSTGSWSLCNKLKWV